MAAGREPALELGCSFQPQNRFIFNTSKFIIFQILHVGEQRPDLQILTKFWLLALGTDFRTPFTKMSRGSQELRGVSGKPPDTLLA